VPSRLAREYLKEESLHTARYQEQLRLAARLDAEKVALERARDKARRDCEDAAAVCALPTRQPRLLPTRTACACAF